MKKLPLRAGMDLPRFGSGLVDGFTANEFIMKILQAFVRLQVKNGTAKDPKFTLSDSNAVLELGSGSGGGGGGTGSANIQLGVITGVNQDTWTVAAGGATLSVNRPPALKGSIAHSNFSRYDGSYNLSFVAVDYDYSLSADYTIRTETASGYLTETAVLYPPIQKLQTDTVTSAGNSGGNCVIGITNGFTAPPFGSGQYVFFTGITFTNGHSYQKVVSTTGSSPITSFTVTSNISGGLGAGATASFGGTQILIAQDTGGTWWDLNVDGRKWSTSSLLIPP